MFLHRIHIKNFRKLNNCSIVFNEHQTIFVGANNSGKTSAIQSIIRFLKDSKDFSCKDFTISNWNKLNLLFESLIDTNPDKRKDIELNQVRDFLPMMDVWLDVPEDEVYLVKSLFPSLTWDSKYLGARLLYAPKNIKELFIDYAKKFERSRELKMKNEKKNIDIFPNSLFDFLNHNNGQNLRKYFEIKYYVLDIDKEPDNYLDIQPYPDVELDENPFDTIIRVDSIEAHREFSDPSGGYEEQQDTLSKQLQNYYKLNIHPNNDLDECDLPIIGAIQEVNQIFDTKLMNSFAERFNELNDINYPGFLNPTIEIHSYSDPSLSINHESAVQFAVGKNQEMKLPEKYNGLGYRNLISMYFRLIQFREEWLNNKKNDEEKDDTTPERIHLVFIEEPEAHLHAQAQQVFIRKAYETLTNSKFLKENKGFTTQLIVSTHSNHIANEVDLNVMRYFQRYLDEQAQIPFSNVIDLSQSFGNENETRKFVTRYLKLTHCDIFFADAVILVEGAGERILMPHFIKNEGLDKNYISIIEINGSHAHRFKNLIEKLKIYTLVVTDIDAQSCKNGKYSKDLTRKGKNQRTNNDTLKTWIPKKENIDELLDLPSEEKVIDQIRVSYQIGIKVKYNKKNLTAYPYTFEDALGLTNIQLFREVKNPKGMVKYFQDAMKEDSLSKCVYKMFLSLKDKYKAPFAIDMLYMEGFENLQTPYYIKEGLDWLKSKIEIQNND